MVVGSINWGLWGLFNYDLVQDFIGANVGFYARMIYVLIGLSGVYGITFLFNTHLYGKCCSSHEEPKDKE
jgi:uncharacterized membrane protein YuzA (DUF378 family)